MTILVLLLIIGLAGLVFCLYVFGLAKRKSALNNAHQPSSGLESSLKNEKLKSDIIINSIGDGVLLIDNHKKVQLANPAACALTGWPQNEAIDLDFNTIIKLVNDKGDAYTQQNNPIDLAYASKENVHDNHAVLVSRDNKTVPVDVSVTPLVNSDGGVNGVVCIFSNVSETRGEEQRRAEFISTASHEMRTPVAAIEGYLALALNDKVSKIDSKAREYLDKAHSSTQHLGQLFQDLLTSAKAEDGRLSSHPVVVEIGDFLEKLVDDLRLVATKKGLTMEYVVGADSSATKVMSEEDYNDDETHAKRLVRPLYYATVDPDRFREVITNLFDNAVKYTDAGKISIGLTGNDAVVQLRISDTGSGIPEADIPHLFQKFYRVDNSSTRTIGGTGLGLFICRKIVELYSGRIWVESKVGEGSSFYINLPKLSTEKAKQLLEQEAKAPMAQEQSVKESV